MWSSSFQVSSLQAAGPPHPRERCSGNLLPKQTDRTRGPLLGGLTQARGSSEDESGRRGAGERAGRFFSPILPHHMELSRVPTITQSIKPPMEEQTFPILQPYPLLIADVDKGFTTGQSLWQVLPEVPHLILSSPETSAIIIPIFQVS